LAPPDAPKDRPPPEEVFAERWPEVPPSKLDRDDPRRVALEVAEELLQARGHLLAAVERVRSAAALRRRMREGPDGEPGA
jgi:hypothetical protein